MAKKPTPNTGLKRAEKSIKAWQKAGKPTSLMAHQTKRLLTGGSGASGASAPTTTSKKTVKRGGGKTPMLRASKKPARSGSTQSTARQRLKRRARS